MKKITSLFAFFAVYFVLIQCAPEEDIANTTTSISFAIQNIEKDFPEESYASITLASKSGQTFTHELKLNTIGGSVITDPLKLNPNDELVLEDFFIVSDGAVLYAMPKKDSELGRNLDVSRLSPTNELVSSVLHVNVFSTRQHAADKFGYKAFILKQKQSFKIAVYVEDGGKQRLTDAKMSIGAPYLTFNYVIEPKVNTIVFEGDSEIFYTMTIMKPGYKSYSAGFSYSEWTMMNGNKPVKIILQALDPMNVFSVTPVASEGTFAFTIGLRNTGNITVNWGDGSSENIFFAPSDTVLIPSEASYVTLSHQFNTPATGPITIAGDVQEIFSYSQGSSPISDIDVTKLPGLLYLTLEDSDIGNLDLTHNPILSGLTIVSSNANITLGGNYALTDVFLMGDISTATVDRLMTQLYANVVAENVTDGVAMVRNLSPAISAESLSVLQQLETNYWWYALVYP
jgi:hypothetical protein